MRMKVDDLSDKVLATVRDSDRAVTPTFVAKKLGIHWLTARALLLVLASKGEIQAEEIASHGMIFRSKVTVAETVP